GRRTATSRHAPRFFLPLLQGQGALVWERQGRNRLPYRFPPGRATARNARRTSLSAVAGGAPRTFSSLRSIPCGEARNAATFLASASLLILFILSRTVNDRRARNCKQPENRRLCATTQTGTSKSCRDEFSMMPSAFIRVNP